MYVKGYTVCILCVLWTVYCEWCVVKGCVCGMCLRGIICVLCVFGGPAVCVCACAKGFTVYIVCVVDCILYVAKGCVWSVFERCYECDCVCM